MAFGQQSGRPATVRQLRDLTALVEAAGHTGFKDARGPLGLNQRQAAGRFTQDEATALIARLEAEADESADVPAGPAGRPRGPRGAGGTGTDGTGAPGPDAGTAMPPAATRRQSLARQLERVPEDLLVDELRRRGWTVTPP